MNIDRFKLSEYEYFTCDECGKSIKKEFANPSKSRENGTTKRCKKCDYLFRHDAISDAGLTPDELDVFLQSIFNLGATSINEIQKSIPYRSLEELCLAYTKLKLHNKPMTVFTNCLVCGKCIEKNPAYFVEDCNKFCSSECYWKHKRENAKTGKESPFYDRIETKCSNCGKVISIIKWSYNKTNKFGENNNFCSHDCYCEFRKTHYVGDKSYWHNRKRSPSTCEKIKRQLLKRMKSDSRLNTNIQLLVNNMLDSIGIRYEREKTIGYYSIDNFIIDKGLCIEVMGDYWHANPNKYNEHRYKLSDKQCGWILKDKQKIGYLLSHGYRNPLYLWESDILHNPNLCRKLIEGFILFNGALEDYNSFNYSLCDGELRKNSVITLPYQYMKSSEYKTSDLLIKAN